MEKVSKIALAWFKFYLLENEKPFINNYKIKSERPPLETIALISSNSIEAFNASAVPV